jgi:hypothetical protein
VLTGTSVPPPDDIVEELVALLIQILNDILNQ